MFGDILKATNSSFQKGMIFCRSICVKKVMKLLAFIFEQPSYLSNWSGASNLISLVFLISLDLLLYLLQRSNLIGRKSLP